MCCARWCFSLSLLFSVLGCGGAETRVSQPIAPVSGKILLNGSPLVGATVTFQPLASQKNLPTSTGKTDSEGKYSLEILTNGRQGAVVGEHVVLITHPDDDAVLSSNKDDEDAGTAIAKPPRKIPERYSKDSQFKFTVEAAGATDADFELKSP